LEGTDPSDLSRAKTRTPPKKEQKKKFSQKKGILKKNTRKQKKDFITAQRKDGCGFKPV